MNLTDILLIVVIVLLLLLFLAMPVANLYTRIRGNRAPQTQKPAESERPSGPREAKPDRAAQDGHDLSGGARVEEPAGALESGYRRVDAAQDLSTPQGTPGKKNGKPH